MLRLRLVRMAVRLLVLWVAVIIVKIGACLVSLVMRKGCSVLGVTSILLSTGLLLIVSLAFRLRVARRLVRSILSWFVLPLFVVDS